MYIRKKDLIKLLKPYNDNDILVIGNNPRSTENIKPLEKIKKCIYLPDKTTKTSGGIYIRKLSDKLIAQGFSEKDLCPDKPRGIPAVILIPVE